MGLSTTAMSWERRLSFNLALALLLIPSQALAFVSLKSGGYWGRGELRDAPFVGAEYGQSVQGVIPSASVFHFKQEIPNASLPEGDISVTPLIASLYSDILYKGLSFHMGGGAGYSILNYDLGKDQSYINSLGVEEIKVSLDDSICFTALFGLEKKGPDFSVGIEFLYLWLNPRFTALRVNHQLIENHLQEGFLDLSGIFGGLEVRF